MAGFAKDIAAWSDKTRVKIETAIRKIALDVFTEVVLKTPVDEGTARGNWLVAIGEIPTGTIEFDDPTGTATISKIQAETMKLQAGEVIYLTNSLPYILRLENGWSQQAPQGMVKLTVQRWRPIVDAVARELSKS